MSITKHQAYYFLLAFVLGMGFASYYFRRPYGGGPAQNGVIHRFSMSQSDVQMYGFYYPVTFQFSVSSSDVEAWKSYDSVAWQLLPQKFYTDFFNGEECYRVDGDTLYVSAAFNGNPDLFLSVTDSNGNSVNSTFVTVTKYYDNRRAVFTSSFDDYNFRTNYQYYGTQWYDRWMGIIDTFQTYKLWIGIGVITNTFREMRDYGRNTGVNWEALQQQVNEGYVEVQSHSVNHIHVPYDQDSMGDGYASSYDYEIRGSREHLLGNITNMPYGHYVYVWIQPFGSHDETVRQKCSQYGYLYDRSIATGITTFYSFQTKQSVVVGGTTFNLDYGWGNLAASFNNAYQSGGVFHVWGHPYRYDVDDSLRSQLSQIGGKLDVWYVPLGRMYAYRYVSQFVTYEEI